jgi:dihydroorotase
MSTADLPISPDSLTITRPDDWHLHVRDGAAMAAVVPHTARQFGRAIIMPNLRPPVTTTAQAWSTASASWRTCRPGWPSSR